MNALTQQQQHALSARGNVILVAGAGTGKTSTLVARCLQLIEKGASLENILMVTFTDAAAAEMRHRIRGALEQRLKECAAPAGSPDLVEHLEQQLALLDTAQISTLHSFCLQLVRAHFHELAIDPQVVVLDESQTAPLMSQSLDAVLQRHYTGASPESEAVRELIRGLGRGSEENIRQRILHLHRYSQSRADTEAWLAAGINLFSSPEPAHWRALLQEALPQWCREWREDLLRHATVPAIGAAIAALDRLTVATNPADQAAALDAILAAGADGKWDGKRGQLRRQVDAFFTDAAFLRSQFADTAGSDPLAADWELTRHPMLALLRLARDFATEFGQAKRALGGVDFADLEQFALRLLQAQDANAPAHAYREQFHHVFVDEYQDINSAQDAILSAVSRTGEAANRFLVGDVKQSIYRFRLANPNIFRDYQRQWSQPAPGSCLPLTENFRSREAILQFVNQFFAPLMRESVGGVVYDAEAELRFGAPGDRQDFSLQADEGAPPRVELHWLTRESEAETDAEAGAPAADLDTTEREARLIATRLRRLRDSAHPIWDKEQRQFRPVNWGDMVVLLRSLRSKAEVFAKAFHQLGVPLHAERGGFFDSLEIMDLLNLLRVLDNPLQDVPLLAVLRSPLAGLTLDELAAIRAHNREKLFWTALQVFLRDEKSGEASAVAAAAYRKANEFKQRFGRWRDLTRKHSLSHCLEAALNETHYEALLHAEPRAAEREANVRRLLDLVRAYDPLQRQGLFRFLRFVDAQQEAGVEDEPVSLFTEQAVRLMSVHQSKGLEFPVVVVGDAGKRFNDQSLREDILLDERLGLCPRVVDMATGARYPGLTHWLANRRESRELRGEELRLLYVAMTRARDLLILTGTTGKNADAARESVREPGTLTDRMVAGARSYFDWIKLWLPHVTHETDWTEDYVGRNGLLGWRIYSAGGNEAIDINENPGTDAASNAPELSGADLRALNERISWQYPFQPATKEPAKTSATALRRRWQEDEDATVAEWARAQAIARSRVRAAQTGSLTPAEVGTAHHTFLELVDLAHTGSLDALKNQAQQMREAGALNQLELAALDFDALLDFCQGDLGRRIREHADQVEREVPFTLRLTPVEMERITGRPHPAKEPGEFGADDYVVVQGFADLIVVLDNEIWLLDFKTDRVQASGLDAKAADYGPQLRLYAEALSRVYGLPVTEKWLHFLALGKAVPVR